MQASLSIMPASRVLDTLIWPNHDGAATDCGSTGYGHCGLAAEPGPREIMSGLPRE